MTETQNAPAASPARTPNLNKALSLLQGELPRIKKTKTAEVKDQQGNRVLYKYDYADLGDVVADVGPLLAKCGLAFHCGPTINPADRREMILVWSLLHESGEEKTGEWPLGPVNQKPQSLGSAITYGRRYCFTAATNIVLEDDDDGQRAQQAHGSRQSAGDAWESSTPARPMNQGPRQESRQQDGPPVPSPLDPDDAWAQLIADIKTPEDGDAAEVQLKKAWEAGEIDDQRTHQVKHWIRIKAAPMRTAAKSPPAGSGSPVAEPATDESWVGNFVVELATTPLEGLTALRGRIGRAVAERKITPEEGSTLAGEVIRRKRELEQDAAGEPREAEAA